VDNFDHAFGAVEQGVKCHEMKSLTDAIPECNEKTNHSYYLIILYNQSYIAKLPQDARFSENLLCSRQGNYLRTCRGIICIVFYMR
jgi:hypothetical protein